jgi:hypothetical protein
VLVRWIGVVAIPKIFTIADKRQSDHFNVLSRPPLKLERLMHVLLGWRTECGQMTSVNVFGTSHYRGRLEEKRRDPYQTPLKTEELQQRSTALDLQRCQTDSSNNMVFLLKCSKNSKKHPFELQLDLCLQIERLVGWNLLAKKVILNWKD